jgi:predicted ATPase/DNA-binding CsgD family transcriptional regulator
MDLVGREQEQATLFDLFVRQPARLVTLTGPGGIGKTSLARWAASDLAESFTGGAQFVDLSSIAEPELFAQTVAGALNIADTSDESLIEALAASLRGRQLLLILDNFEHIQAAASDVAVLLQRCPRLSILVTSRAALHLPEEHTLAVPPLDIAPALSLFAQRARAARPDFALSDTNTHAVSEICTRLDGIPLAIELAAARIKVLSAEQLAQRLADRLGLLTNGASDAPARHRTLRAALDWSYHQLADGERRALRHLAVFRGSAVLEAVEHVCGDANVIDHVEQLVDQSLLTVHEEGGAARYRVLETVREYALEQLCEAAEDGAARARHADWYRSLAEQAAPELAGQDQQAWLERVDREHDNLRAALSCLVEKHDGSGAIRLAGALWKFWEVRGHATEGHRWLEAALALDDGSAEPMLRATALHGAAILAWVRGDYARTIELHAKNVAVRESIGDRHGVAVSLLHLANVMRSQGSPDLAIDHCSQSLALFRELGDKRWCANTLTSLGMALFDRREFVRARAALEECVGLSRELGGTRRIAAALGNLGDVARAEGNLESALSLLAESLELFAEVRDAWGSSACLESLALVACAQDEPVRAAQLFGAADGQREQAGVPLPPADRPAHDRALSTLRTRLGREQLASAVAHGRQLSLYSATALALEPVETASRVSVALPLGDSPLTEREREVASLVARGLTNRQIAEALVITKQTADKHVGNILGKLGAASRAQVAVWFVQQTLRAGAAAS